MAGWRAKLALKASFIVMRTAVNYRALLQSFDENPRAHKRFQLGAESSLGKDLGSVGAWS